MIRKLLQATDLDVELLRDRLIEIDRPANGAEYDAVVEQDAARCADDYGTQFEESPLTTRHYW